MNSIELDMMKGIVNILNDAIAANNNGNPIMTDIQFETRFEDLKQFENETSFAFTNSPTQNIMIETKDLEDNYSMLSFTTTHNAEELVEFINNREMVASVKLSDSMLFLKYKDGILVSCNTNHLKQFTNVPAKIKKEGTYSVIGEAVVINDVDLKLFVFDIVDGGSNSLRDNLKEAKELGFDIVPYWFNDNSANALNPKNLQGNIEYVYEYTEENELPCNGVLFRFNDVELKNGIVYQIEMVK